MNKLQDLSTVSLSSSLNFVPTRSCTGEFIDWQDPHGLGDDTWYRISNVQDMTPFFMSLISAGEHWMFVASDGALTAGRRNPDSSLFPYYSADKIIDMRNCTGPKTVLWVQPTNGDRELWEPFSATDLSNQNLSRHLYKNSPGSRILFEEVHHKLGLRFQYGLAFGSELGFIRQCRLINQSNSPIQVSITDGLANLLPSGLTSEFQLRYSNLADAYKKSERIHSTPLAVYYLSSIPTDRAEPSEGLKATVAWQFGLAEPQVSLSPSVFDRARLGRPQRYPEDELRGQRGTYAISSQVHIGSGQQTVWHVVADIDQDHVDVLNLEHRLRSGEDMSLAICEDIRTNEMELKRILSASDGYESGANLLRVWRHRSNVLFNVMRGGLPMNNHRIARTELMRHVNRCNHRVGQENREFLNSLPDTIEVAELRELTEQTGDRQLCRITAEYLPLRFSRRHGDPTRPWNRFSINLLDESGQPSVRYQGNWRDIFQNWEALALSYPDFTFSMVSRFLNASTADGYNPYRINERGFEWEEPDPSDPWANIGYWGDHQIVYLLRLLQWCHHCAPSQLSQSLLSDRFTYADIPYRIRSYKAIRRDPQVTIDYDIDHAERIQERVNELGSDGRFLTGDGQQPYQVNLIEKLLVPALTKLTNFVPEGGIWLNTQRPEWNDANNALVGRGLSMVTTCHLRSYLVFLIELLSVPKNALPSLIPISSLVHDLVLRIGSILDRHQEAFAGPISDVDRSQIMDALSQAGSDYRETLYQKGLQDLKADCEVESLLTMLNRARVMIEHTIARNRRADGLYHSYNLLELDENTASVSNLHEMLEGQVAVLESGFLSASESLEVLDALGHSSMYREDQKSYMLYPDRRLPRFLDKNRIPTDQANRSELISQLLADGNRSIVRQDVSGGVHFNGDFRNVRDLNAALDRLRDDSAYGDLAGNDRPLLNEIFERTFEHRSFTGRSGTFFGYEGLGSIYWHMVSKLGLAVMRYCVETKQQTGSNQQKTLRRLLAHYHNIRDGLGLTKTPIRYGAFPTDPYSHTPKHAGVQQPGMTGQVKEDILARWAELGIVVRHGIVSFDPFFLDIGELTKEPTVFEFYDVTGSEQLVPISRGSFAFTLCQVPVVYHQGESAELRIERTDAPTACRKTLALSEEESRLVFARRGIITRLDVTFDFDHATL